MKLVRGLAGLVGEVMITVGAVLLLFVGWQLWWTDVVADADAGQAVTALQDQFDDARVPPAQVKLGDAFAIVRIPRFGTDFARPLYEGTARDILQRGIGHYRGTAMPGAVGNFAMAGHRTTSGKPFNQIDKLKAGDAVLIETRSTSYLYRVTEWEIVAPTQTSVLLPVPNQPDAKPTAKLLTLTSCHPEFSARQRYIVRGVLAGTYPRAQGVPADVLRVSG